MKTMHIAFATLLAVSLMACPAQPAPVTPPTDNDAGPSQFSTEQRENAMKRVELEYERLLKANPSTALEVLVQYTKAQPEFAHAAAGQGTLLARFKDGRGFVFMDNFNGNAKDSSPQSALASASVTTPTSTARPQTILRPQAAASVLPATNTALVMRQGVDDTVGNDPGMDKIQKSLEKRGYVVQRVNTITIENLKAISNLPSVVYMHGHGATWYWDNQTEDIEYSLMTDNLISSANDQLYADDLRTGRILYSRVRERRQDPTLSPGRYTVTGRFFAKYVRFAPRALVYMNACNSAEAQATLFRQTLNAGVYIGYDGSTTDFGYEPAAYFFDRLLGGNYAEPPKPHGRVFTVDQVWDAMPKKRHAQSPNVDYLTDPRNQSKLTKFGNALRLIAPNIKSLRFPGQDVMQIFTDVPGDEPDLQVKIAGKPVPFTAAADHLRVQLDSTMNGDVTLEVRGIRSNARPITSWRVPVAFKPWIAPGSGENGHVLVNFDLHLRADAYEVRDIVDGPLREEGHAFYASMDSQARYTFGGTYGPGLYTGSGTLQYHFSPERDKFSSTGYVHALERRMRLSPLFCCVKGSLVTPTVTVDVEVGQALPFEFSELTAPQPGREIVLKGWFMDLDTDHAIKARSVSNQMQGVEFSTISWPRVSAVPAYRDGVER